MTVRLKMNHGYHGERTRLLSSQPNTEWVSSHEFFAGRAYSYLAEVIETRPITSTPSLRDALHKLSDTNGRVFSANVPERAMILAERIQWIGAHDVHERRAVCL